MNSSSAGSNASHGNSTSGGKSESSKESSSFKESSERIVKCFFCGQKGHVRSKCEKWKHLVEGLKKPVALLSQSPRTGDSEIPEGFVKYSSDGTVSSGIGKPLKKVKLLRDTGAMQSLILRTSLPDDFVEAHEEYVVLDGFPNTLTSSPRETLFLNSKWSNGLEKLAIVDRVPVGGIDVVIGNDIADREQGVCPILSPVAQDVAAAEFADERAESPLCVVTRSKVRPIDLEEVNLDFERGEESLDLSPVIRKNDQVPWNREALSKAQREEFKKEEEVTEEPNELAKPRTLWYNDILYRFSRTKKAPAIGGRVSKQIVVPEKYRNKLLSLAHDNHLAGHFGMHKTMKRIGQHFFWPRMKNDIRRYVQTCEVCQKVGKPNQVIPKAPLIPIPVVNEPFQEVIIDIVGPLPRTRSGHEYLLTLMDRMSKYPEAIPVRSIKSPKIVDELIGFFTKFGLPKIIQSDCGSNFTCKYFQEKMRELGIKHVTSSPYHPESQGQLERFHQTLKSMLKKFCLENESEWDKEIPYVLFAFRSVPGEALNYSPFQLVFGHSVRGPLDVVREHWEGETPDLDLLSYITELGGKLTKAWDFAKQNLKKYQGVMKGNFDKKAKIRKFEVGDQVLVLLPSPRNPLKASFSGPWLIEEKVSEVNYWVSTPERRRKRQLCHVNMLKPYFPRNESKLW